MKHIVFYIVVFCLFVAKSGFEQQHHFYSQQISGF